MRAVGVTEFGGPEALHLVDVPAEPLGAGQVRVRVSAATVNPTDTHARAGAYADRDPVKEFPYVPGMDVAGVLAEIGEGVQTDLAVGDHVMGIVVPSGAHGGYREDIVLPAGSVARVPAGVGDVAASTLPMNGLTARLALDLMDLQPGQVLAVTGATGAFGGYVVQLAKAEGSPSWPTPPRPTRTWSAGWVPTSSSGAGTASPTGSVSTSLTGWTGWSTARCRTPRSSRRSGTAARSPPCAATAGTANGACGSARCWSAGTPRSRRSSTGCASRWRRAR